MSEEKKQTPAEKAIDKAASRAHERLTAAVIDFGRAATAQAALAGRSLSRRDVLGRVNAVAEIATPGEER